MNDLDPDDAAILGTLLGVLTLVAVVLVIVAL